MRKKGRKRLLSKDTISMETDRKNRKKEKGRKTITRVSLICKVVQKLITREKENNDSFLLTFNLVLAQNPGVNYSLLIRGTNNVRKSILAPVLSSSRFLQVPED